MLVRRAFYCSRETLIKSLSDFTLEILCIARNNLTRIAIKEGYDEAMYKNSCRIWLCDLISVSLNAAGPITSHRLQVTSLS